MERFSSQREQGFESRVSGIYLKLLLIHYLDGGKSRKTNQTTLLSLKKILQQNITYCMVYIYNIIIYLFQKMYA